jgi:hypothetical protein
LGATPLVLIHFPPSVDCKYRRAAGARTGDGSGVDDAGGEQLHRQRGLPTLRGDAHGDEILLRGLQPTSVRDMRRWWASSRVPLGEVHEVQVDGAPGGGFGQGDSPPEKEGVFSGLTAASEKKGRGTRLGLGLRPRCAAVGWGEAVQQGGVAQE